MADGATPRPGQSTDRLLASTVSHPAGRQLVGERCLSKHFRQRAAHGQWRQRLSIAGGGKPAGEEQTDGDDMRIDELRRITIIVIAAALATASCSPGGGIAGQPPTTSPPAVSAGSSYADLVERVSPHVVTVRTDTGVGSGVIFRSDVVLTNEHVVGQHKRVVVSFADGATTDGVVLATDPVTDLAVVRTARTGLPVAEFRRELPRPGDPVLTIGSPLGFENSVTAGIDLPV